MEKMEKYSVIIIGGGLAGLCLASTLVSKNISTLIIDNQNNPINIDAGDRRTTALMESSVMLLKNLQVWDEKSLIATPLNTMRIFQITPPNTLGAEISFCASDVERQYLAYNVDNHALRITLCNKIASDKNITHLFNASATNMTKKDTGWQVDIDNKSYHGDLIVGADGRGSFCRETIGIETIIEDYKQSAIVFNVKHSTNHNNSSTEFMYPEGAFTFVPMARKESAVVWVDTTENALSYKKDPALLERVLIRKSQGKFGDIDIISDVQTFPLNKVIANTSIADNLCLIAEAHHGITPVAAQGLNLSLRDVSVLGELISNTYKIQGNVCDDAMLKTYEKLRRVDIKTRSIGTELFHKFSRRSDPISGFIKTVGIGFLNRVSPAKKALINLGLSFPNGTPNYMKKDFTI